MERLDMYKIYEELRTARGLSDNAVALATELPKSVLSDWKNGKSSPSTKTLIKLADYFDVSVDHLLGRE